MNNELLWVFNLISNWLVSMVGLILTGLVLSWQTLWATNQAQYADQFAPSFHEKAIRTIYRVVVGLLSIYFYLSMPLVMLLVLTISLVGFYFLLSFGSFSIWAGVFLFGFTIYTFIAFVRGVFARTPQGPLGKPMSQEDAPTLWACVYEVAERIGTRPLDAIHITPDPSIGVVERGGFIRKMRGGGERCLILGLGALPGMTQAQFKAILAHEYGHFINRDTSGGTMVRRVRLAIGRMAESLHINGQDAWYNPAWLFITGFHRIFLYITLGASRLQEVLADRFAASAYGGQHLIDGLTHVVAQSYAFDANVDHKADLSRRLNKDLPNLYLTVELPDTIQSRLEPQIQAELARDTNFRDSHPAFKTRVRYLQQLIAVSEADEDTQPVWDLFEDAESLQCEMTMVIQRDIEAWCAQHEIWEAQQRWGY
ncbi:MAG: M48 family metallopeptidase [Chloroflexota bacterium]